MSYYTITLKGETYYIPTSRKTDIQRDIKDIEVKIENYKNLIKDLERDKKIKQLNLLDDRQLIIYENQYPKLLSSDKLKENKQYLKRESLLKAYDNKHGTYIQPSI
jgi:hypothetical protein